MKIEVQLYAGLRRYASSRQTPFIVELPEGSCIADALEILCIPDDEKKVILLNGRPSDKNTVLNRSDKLTLFPPVAGG